MVWPPDHYQTWGSSLVSLTRGYWKRITAALFAAGLFLGWGWVVWQAVAPVPRLVLQGQAIGFSPDGKKFATMNDCNLQLWD
ncbi:MAG: hypothetical protein ACRD36_02975, partial [Candidatus Acidiferrum sp.]